MLIKLFIFVLIIGNLSSAYGKCTQNKITTISLKQLLIYNTDSYHKYANLDKPIVYDLSKDDLSQSEQLRHIASKKETDKKCSLFTKTQVKLKNNELIRVEMTSAHDNQLTITFNHPHLERIQCTGVETVADLQDVLNPYIIFSCKDLVPSLSSL